MNPQQVEQVIQTTARALAQNAGNRITDELSNGILLGINQMLMQFVETPKVEEKEADATE